MDLGVLGGNGEQVLSEEEGGLFVGGVGLGRGAQGEGARAGQGAGHDLLARDLGVLAHE